VIQSYVVSAPACRATALTKNGAQRIIKHRMALSSEKPVVARKLLTKTPKIIKKGEGKGRGGGDGKTEYGGVKAM
jgi:hypothetical protein